MLLRKEVNVKKRIFILILFLLGLISLNGCKAKSDLDNFANNEIPFNFYKSFTLNDNTYDLYCIKNPKLFDQEFTDDMRLIRYLYKRYDKINISKYHNWRINTLYQYEYLVDVKLNNELLEMFNDNIVEKLVEYQISLDMKFEHYNEKKIIEKEFIVDQSKTYDYVYLIDLCIPFKLINRNTTQIYNINIPVKTILAYQDIDQMEFVYDEFVLTTDYHSFFSFDNVQAYY